jgi:uncharacterized protein YcbK (DUF882 family)
MRGIRVALATVVAIGLAGLPGGRTMAGAQQTLAPATTMAASDPAMPVGAKVYRLRLYQLHTGESLDVVYRIGDAYVPSAIAQLNTLLRDYRTGTVTDYDVKEFDLLHRLMARLGRPNGVIDIVCGYRTPETNALLRAGSAESGVAEHSQHMEAKAIDIRVPGVSTARLRNAALALEAGGVGYYPRSRFVHVDVGPVRTWSFGEGRPGGRHRAAHGARRRHVALPREAE